MPKLLGNFVIWDDKEKISASELDRMVMAS
jgi:hypothetical protein